MQNGKVAVITGSSSGIGLLTAVEFARSGYRVVALMRDLKRRERLDEAAQKLDASKPIDVRQLNVTDFDAMPSVIEEINRERVCIDVRQLDVTDFDAMPHVIDDILRDHGRIDVLVNNAGFSSSAFVEEVALHELRDQMETNFFGAVAMTKAVLPVMRKQRFGHIIQVSSVSGEMPVPMLSSYTASKFALEGWSEALRIEVHSLGIRVVIVQPGSYETDIWTRNLKIGRQALDPNSPNRERSQRFAAFVKSTAAKRGDPKEVAELIVCVAEDPNPRLRYLIGRGVHAQKWFRRLTPWRTYERIMAKATKID
jgi:NAD(P)-dependent dehydrogenase (short-subunit alcohol dehydrogenase family)